MRWLPCGLSLWLAMLQPILRPRCWDGAKFVTALLKSIGFEVKLVQVVASANPIVFARLGDNPAHPTVTVHGHYDVQV